MAVRKEKKIQKEHNGKRYILKHLDCNQTTKNGLVAKPPPCRLKMIVFI